MNQTTTNGPTTLLEAIQYFSDYQNAHDFMVNVRWGGGAVCCPNCGSTRIRYIQTRRQWECREQHPKRRFSLKTGTIMEDSPIPLQKWLAALWMEVNCKNSISSWELHRGIGVTQKTAWFLLHRLRHALHIGSFDKKLCGTVEADETYVGGSISNMHTHKKKGLSGRAGSKDKAIVMGILERGGEVRAKVLKNTHGETLHKVIRKNVEPGTKVYTDDLKAYRSLRPEYLHDFVSHAITYVRGAVHTNGIENFWALFKRCIKGTHISIEPFHLQAYLDSEMFRFNNRGLKDGGRFEVSAPGMIGKRLTYKALIGALEGERTNGKIS